MPKHLVHNFIDEVVFGRSFPKVHKAIDLPFVVLGRRHRQLFHDPFEAFVMGTLASGNFQGGLSGLLHVKLDKECSKKPILKKQLEQVARLKKWREREARRWKKEMLQTRKRREAQEKRRSATFKKRLKQLF